MKQRMKKMLALVVSLSMLASSLPAAAEDMAATPTDLPGETPVGQEAEAPIEQEASEEEEPPAGEGQPEEEEAPTGEEQPEEEEVPAGEEQPGESEAPAEQEAELFASGYAWVKAGAVVYADTRLTEEAGTMDGRALVWVTDRREVNGADRDVLTVHFATEDAVREGYVRAGDCEPVDEAAAAGLVKDAELAYGTHALCSVSFMPVTAAEPEELAGTETPAEAEESTGTETEPGIPAETEKPAEAPEAAKTEAPAATPSDLPEKQPAAPVDAPRAAVTAQKAVQTGDKEVTVTWEGTVEAYKIYEGAKLLTAKITGDGNSWTAVVSSLSYAEHTLKVVPVEDGAAQQELAAACEPLTVAVMAARPVVKAVQGTAEDGVVNLTWTIYSTTQAASYTVYEVMPDGSRVVLQSGISKKIKKYTVTGAAPGEHTYVVGAATLNAADRVNLSAPVTVEVVPLWTFAPATTTAKQKALTDTAVAVTWKARYARPDHWCIMDNGEKVAEAPGDAVTITLTGVEPGAHVYTVAPADANGAEGKPGTAVKVSVVAKWLLEANAPKLTAAAGTKLDKTVNLTMKAGYGCIPPYYDIYDLSVSETEPLMRVKSGNKSTVSVTLTEQSYSDHVYRVQGVNEAGQKGTPSQEVAVTVQPLWCQAVTKTKATLPVKTTGAVRVSWQAAFPAPDYRVKAWAVTADGETPAGEWLSGGELFVLTDILANGAYRFEVTPIGTADGIVFEGKTASLKYTVTVNWKKAPTVLVYQQKTAAETLKLTVKPASSNSMAQMQVRIDGCEWIPMVSGTVYTDGNGVTYTFKPSWVIIVTDLREGVEHTVEARYITEAGECSLITSKLVTLLPASLFAVTKLSVLQTEENTITIRWTPFALREGTRYRLQVLKGKTEVSVQDITDLSSVIIVPGAAKYTVNLTPVDDTFTGDKKSGTVSVVSAFWKKAPVVNDYRQTDAHEVTIWFNAAKAATNYAVYDAGKLVTENVTLHLDGENSYVMIGGLSGKHYFQLEPQQQSGSTLVKGTKTAKMTITVGTMRELNDVTELEVTSSGVGTATIAWTAPYGTAFRVYDKDIVTGTVMQVTEEALTIREGWTAELTGLSAGAHAFGVQPVYVKANGEEAEGAIVWSAETVVQLPGTDRRTDVAAVQMSGAQSVIVDWKNPEGAAADSIRIYLDGTLVLTVAGTQASATVSGVSIGKHELELTAVSDTYGEGKPSVPVTVYVFDAVTLQKPTNVTYTLDDMTGSVTFSWKAGGAVHDLFRVCLVTDDGYETVAETDQLSAVLSGGSLGVCEYVIVPVSRLEPGIEQEGIASAAVTVTISKCTTEDGVTYTADLTNNTAAVTAYDGHAAKLVIPEKIGACTVTSIAASVFEGNAELECIDLPDTITAIGKRAFANCIMLSEMK